MGFNSIESMRVRFLMIDAVRGGPAHIGSTDFFQVD